MQTSNSNQTSNQSQSCSSQNKDDPRVLILENDSLSNKLKLIEQNFQSQIAIMKLEINKKMSEMAATQLEQMKKVKTIERFFIV